MAGMNIDLKNIKLTKQQQQNLIAAVLLLGGLGYGYFNFWLSPIQAKLKKESVVLEQKRKDLRDARDMVRSYAEFQARASEINRRVDFINMRLPKETNISDTIRELTQKAAEANINIINFQPGRERDAGGFKEYDIVMSFETSYTNLGRFLTGVGYISRLITPANLNITRIVRTGTEVDYNRTINVAMSVKIYSFSE
ncbi:MAG TPA: hypothetical protein ENN43_07365 [bacterium]|nr:hypothetical protein [bacterium]